MFNADYAAALPRDDMSEIDPHGIEEWSFWGYMRYGLDVGMRSFWQMWVAYARFSWSLVRARRMHDSFKRRDRRRRAHRERLYRVAEDTGVAVDTLTAIDRLARTPFTVSTPPRAHVAARSLRHRGWPVRHDDRDAPCCRYCGR